MSPPTKFEELDVSSFIPPDLFSRVLVLWFRCKEDEAIAVVVEPGFRDIRLVALTDLAKAPCAAFAERASAPVRPGHKRLVFTHKGVRVMVCDLPEPGPVYRQAGTEAHKRSLVEGLRMLEPRDQAEVLARLVSDAFNPPSTGAVH